MNRREAIKATSVGLGITLSSSSIVLLLNGCKGSESVQWKPKSMSEATAILLAEMADTILPPTDTPGAKDLNVHHFVDEAIATALGPKHKAHMLDGLNNLEIDLGENFNQKSLEERIAVIDNLELLAKNYNQGVQEKMLKISEAKKSDEPLNAGPMTQSEPEYFQHYYSDLKRLIMYGYFNSQVIGTEVLAYDPIPGAYDPCMPMSDGQKAWTL